MGQGAPMMLSPGATTGMAVMPTQVSGGPHSEASTPTNMQPVSPTSPTMIMQQAACVNGDSGMPMMQPVAIAILPMGMTMPGMGGMQPVPITPPPGYMLRNMNESSPNDQTDDKSPAGEKKV